MATTNSWLKSVMPQPAIHLRRRLRNHYLNLRYERELKRRRTSKRRLLILATVEKSGTNLMRYLVANYIKLASDASTGPVGPVELQSMFPNYWSETYWQPDCYETPTPLMKRIGLDDLTHHHGPYMDLAWDRSKVIHLYRNPLDYAVSCYFFYFVNGNLKRRGTRSGPVEVLERRLEHYADIYLSYREAAKTRNRDILRIAYEDLVTYPLACLRIVLGWLGVEPDPSLAEAAVQYSSKSSVKQLEQGLNPAVSAELTIVRDGSIGQWKEYFADSDVSRIRDRFSSLGVELDDFVLER